MLHRPFFPSPLCPFFFKTTTLSLTLPYILGILGNGLPKWRNWQTRATQTRVPLRIVGSTPTFGIQILKAKSQTMSNRSFLENTLYALLFTWRAFFFFPHLPVKERTYALHQ